ILAGTLFFFGCQEEQSVLSPQLGGKLSKDFVSTLTLDPGATITSATLYLFKTNHSSDVPHDIDVHKIAADWDCPITWNGFLGVGFNPTVEASFITNPINDWVDVDITDVVEGWLAGEDNFGILLKNLDPTNTGGWANWPSSEPGNEFYEFPTGSGIIRDLRPYLEVYVDGNPDPIYILPELDTYVQENRADDSFCDAQLLYAGIAGDFEKYALMRFLVEPTPPGCWQGETAWAANGNEPGSLRYTTKGNWATYVQYAEKTVNVYAGQHILIGTASFSAVVAGEVTITITLDPAWELDPEANGEGVKIQGYDNAPSGNPSPGLFTTYKGNDLTVTVPAYNYYGVHLDVRTSVPCEE
ncbi:MAG: DNRLRE domain-containing protein, partial [Ignavibacteriaceae bacterium]